MTYGDHPPLPESWTRNPFDTAAAFADTGPGRYEDLEEVRVVQNPVEAQQARRDLVDWDSSEITPTVRLNTPESHRATAIQELQDSLQAARRQAENGRGWAAAIGYHPEVKDRISEAIRVLNSALDMMEVFEEGRGS